MSEPAGHLRPLTNLGWGFASNCFVCEPANARGLRIPFFHDLDAGAVVAEFNLDDGFSGAPSYVHGGVILAVLDEAMAWVAIAIAGQWAVTHKSSATFDRPVRVARRYRVEARLTSLAADRILASATVSDHRSRTCASASGEFVPLGAAQAADAIGAIGEVVDASYLRPARGV